MSDRLDVRIITPEKVVFTREVDAISIPGSVGEMEILPGHVALMSTCVPGQLILKDGSEKYIFAAGSGFLEVCANKVVLLLDSATGSAEIDPAASQKLIEEYEDKLKNLASADEENRFAFETKLAAAKARIEVYQNTNTDFDTSPKFSQVNVAPIKAPENDTPAS